MSHRRFRRSVPLALLAAATFGVADANAQKVTNTEVPFAVTGDVNPCNGEAIDYSGFIHFVQTQTDDSSGGSHTHTSINFHDVTGVGDQGNVYRVTLASSGEVNQVGANEETAEEHFNFISKGSAPNVDADVLFHITQDANGDVTATVDKQTLNCRG